LLSACAGGQTGDTDDLAECRSSEIEATMKRVTPVYVRHEVCGQVCGTAEELVDLDDRANQ
jgi:hypothetical protein